MELADRAIFPPNTTHISSDDVASSPTNGRTTSALNAAARAASCLPISCCGFSLFAAFWALSDSLWEQEAVSSMLLSPLGGGFALGGCGRVRPPLLPFEARRLRASKEVKARAVGALALSRLARALPLPPCAGWACRLTFEVLGGLATFFLLAGLLRAFGPMHLDDVHPLGCAYLDGFMAHSHAKYLWIIPIQHDHHNGNVSVPISENRSWCEEMMRLQEEEGYILEMHAHHDWHELDTA